MKSGTSLPMGSHVWSRCTTITLARRSPPCVCVKFVGRALFAVSFFWVFEKNDTPHIWESKNLKQQQQQQQQQQQAIHSFQSPCPLKKPPVKTTTSATKEWEAQNVQFRRRTQQVDGVGQTQGGIRVAISPQALLVKEKILAIRADRNYKLEFRFRFVCISIGFARVY